jgi:hypothetical protein
MLPGIWGDIVREEFMVEEWAPPWGPDRGSRLWGGEPMYTVP